MFKDFKAAISYRINPGQHPGPQINKLVTTLNKIQSVQLSIPKPIAAMMLLSALPQKWDMLISIITNVNALDKLMVDLVREAILSHYETENARGGGK